MELKTFDVISQSELIFGYGAYKQAAPRLKAMGVTKCIVVTGPKIIEAGIVAKVLKTLEDEGIDYVVFANGIPNAPEHTIYECVDMMDREDVDGILSVGGGSVMDTAKISSVYKENERLPLSRYNVFRGTPFKNPRKLPLINMTTTAGTGAEMTFGGPILEESTGLKINVCEGKYMSMKCDLAIVDPGFTMSLPQYLVACTGIDALSHCIEVMVGKERSVVTSLTHGSAVKWIWKYLPVALEKPDDEEARYFLSLAANFALSHQNAIQGHVFGHTITGVYHKMPHGHSCAVTIPATIRYHKESAPDAIEEIAQCIGIDVDTPNLADAVADEIKQFYLRCGLKTPKDMGLANSAEEFADSILPYIEREPYYHEWVPAMTMEAAREYLMSIWE